MFSGESLFMRSLLVRCGDVFHHLHLRNCLPPIYQSREFNSLDSIADSETEVQPIEVRLHGSRGHLQFACNFGVIATEQEQFNKLAFAWTYRTGLVFHDSPSLAWGGCWRQWLPQHFRVLRGDYTLDGQE